MNTPAPVRVTTWVCWTLVAVFVAVAPMAALLLADQPVFAVGWFGVAALVVAVASPAAIRRIDRATRRARRTDPPMAPEMAAVLENVERRSRALAEATAMFNRVYGSGARPATVRVPSERADLPQLEDAPHPIPAETRAEQAKPAPRSNTEGS